MSEKRFKIISEPMANFLCQNQFFKIKNSTLWKLKSWVRSYLHGSDSNSLLDVLCYWWFFQIKASYIWLRFYFFASEEGYPKTNRWMTVRHYLRETMKSQICFQFIWVHWISSLTVMASFLSILSNFGSINSLAWTIRVSIILDNVFQVNIW